MRDSIVSARGHSVDEQLCRCLLLTLDRAPQMPLNIESRLIATVLGVRRERALESAAQLQRLGVIQYSDGQVTVVDRLRLEQQCCECYGVIRRETDRLAPILLSAPETQSTVA